MENSNFQEEIKNCEIMKKIQDTNLKCGGGLGEKCNHCDKIDPIVEEKDVEQDTDTTVHEENESNIEEKAEEYEDDSEELESDPEEGETDSEEPEADGEVESDVSDDNPEESGDTGDLIPMGTASLGDIATGNVPKPTADEIEAAKVKNEKPAKERARQKLESELKNAKDKSFAEPVIGYLLKRCDEDDGLAADVLQSHKTWEKCFSYIYSKARNQSKGNSAVVRDEVVYEWAEDYYHQDDKAIEQAKAKENADRKKQQKEDQKKRIERMEKNHEKNGPSKNSGKHKETPEPKKQEEVKPKPHNKELDGQLDLFSLMGM